MRPDSVPSWSLNKPKMKSDVFIQKSGFAALSIAGCALVHSRADSIK